MAKTARKRTGRSSSTSEPSKKTRPRPRPRHVRPRKREHCDLFERPCPYVGCRYHLYLEVREGTGKIKFNFPGLEVWELEETCALDAAEADGMTLSEIGKRMNLTRERIRQIERIALRKLAALGVDLEEFLTD